MGGRAGGGEEGAACLVPRGTVAVTSQFFSSHELSLAATPRGRRDAAVDHPLLYNAAPPARWSLQRPVHPSAGTTGLSILPPSTRHRPLRCPYSVRISPVARVSGQLTTAMCR